MSMGKLERSSITWAGLPVVGTDTKWAVFSPDMKYRYVLGRVLDPLWNHDLASCLFVIMLNPSTATHEEDDPTIRRCIGFAKRERCSSLVVRNLFAYRSTDPDALLEVDDPVGPSNAHVLNYKVWGRAIAAWGVVAPKLRAKMPALPEHLSCFGTTKDGSPKHPLYLPKTAPIEAWKGARP